MDRESPVRKESLMLVLLRRKTEWGSVLAVSRSIVEAHAGRLWAENNPSGGATFSVALPLSGRAIEIQFELQ
jgi:K+-sensing histidine kinase KdpD